MKKVLSCIVGLYCWTLAAQPVVKLNETGSHYIKLGMTSQIWLRYTEMNPGSGLYGTPVSGLYDVSLRRTRFVIDGMLTDKTYFFVQFGQNNFNLRSPKYTGAFFHDVLSEYHVNDKLHVGAGLTGWSGLLRYASPSVGSVMTLDVPLYQQATNSVNDQFLRKLSVYAKGSWNRFAYRVALTNPMAAQQATTDIGTLNTDQASFSTRAADLQYQGYLQYHFFDKESMKTPYTKGTYLGEKRFLTIGAGIIQQQNAMWTLTQSQDTSYHHMMLLGADVFYESKLDSSHKSAITAYAAYSYFDFGKNYLRNVGVDNPVNTSTGTTGINGPGNNYPMIGTGSTVYAQVGYLRNMNNELGSKWQPYVASQVSDFTYLDDLMIMAEAGVNWYIHGSHNEKISLNYQNRPVFTHNNTSNKNVVSSRASMVQVQFQLAF